MTRSSAGFTLVEIAIVLLILGFLVALVVQGQELIHNARVRSLISQQSAVSTAVLGFQDRFRALPGDYAEASTNIPCTPTCPNGNGNSRIEDVGTPREFILVWTHLSAAGFLNAGFSATSGTVTPGPDDSPTNAFGAYVQVIFDSSWGYSGNTARRHNIKTGNQVPVEILAEVDAKIDDGLPASGRFQFSAYSGAGAAPDWGGAADTCTNNDFPSPGTHWNITNGQSNCGAASLL